MPENSRISYLPMAAVVFCQPAHAVVYMTVEQAQQAMFQGQTLEPWPVVLGAADIARIEQDAGVAVHAGSLRAWKADGGHFFVDAVIGKHDLITYAVALTDAGSVRQVEVLEYREAYGGEVRNANWRGQFVGRRHGDAVRIGQDIKNITGASMSCAHVTDGIRRLLATYAVIANR